MDVGRAKQQAILRDEFLVNMQKFSQSIQRTIGQLEGEVISLLITTLPISFYLI